MLVAGGLSAEDTPVPIPNTVVKLCRADGTAEATWWESTSLPAHMLGSSFGVGPYFLCSNQGVATYSPTAFCAVAAQPTGEYVTFGGLSLNSYYCQTHPFCL